MLTDRGTEYCGKVEAHDYELYLGASGIEHTKTKARHPQTNGICERFHKTILHEFYRVAFRKKIYKSLEELQTDLDQWLDHYNNERTHQGKMCCGRTPMQAFLKHRAAFTKSAKNSGHYRAIFWGFCRQAGKLQGILKIIQIRVGGQALPMDSALFA